MKAVLMHNPVGLLPSRSPAFVEDQCLLHPHQLRRVAVEDLLVFPGCLPVAGVGGSIGSDSGRVFPVAQAEEIPFLLSHLGFPC